MENDTEPSRQLVHQRIRNRIIEYLEGGRPEQGRSEGGASVPAAGRDAVVLELASSFEMQREYQSRAPISVPNEVINQWEDWVDDPTAPAFAPPVFSADEREAISSFHRVWEAVADSTPDPLPPLEESLTLPQWGELRREAVRALRVFARRGRGPEDREI